LGSLTTGVFGAGGRFLAAAPMSHMGGLSPILKRIPHRRHSCGRTRISGTMFKTLIAGYKPPRAAEFVDVLPAAPTGRVLKRELRAKY
jgi:non-ribosomal peptide synthetase component E (peptide arylation enzyme)